MENTGEIITAGVPTTVGDTQAVSEIDTFKPISGVDIAITETEIQDERLGENLGSEEKDLEQIEEILPQEVSDMEKIENVREMIQQEIENRVQAEIEEKGLVTKEDVAYMLMLALLLLKQQEKEGEKSLFEVLIGIISTLIRDMFEPEEMEKRRAEKTKSPQFGVSTKSIKSLMDVFSNRQKSKSSILEMPAS